MVKSLMDACLVAWMAVGISFGIVESGVGGCPGVNSIDFLPTRALGYFGHSYELVL